LDRAVGSSETPGMARKDQHFLCLRRIESMRNMRRFYVLSIQPTLFGGVSLVRHWGGIGTFWAVEGGDVR
jgi:hypothetical protein